MNFSAQKAALTRAIKSGDPQKVIATSRKTVQEWDDNGAWPDAWHRWNIALGDAFVAARRLAAAGNGPYPNAADYDLETLRRA